MEPRQSQLTKWGTFSATSQLNNSLISSNRPITISHRIPFHHDAQFNWNVLELANNNSQRITSVRQASYFSQAMEIQWLIVEILDDGGKGDWLELQDSCWSNKIRVILRLFLSHSPIQIPISSYVECLSFFLLLLRIIEFRPIILIHHPLHI